MKNWVSIEPKIHEILTASKFSKQQQQAFLETLKVALPGTFARAWKAEEHGVTKPVLEASLMLVQARIERLPYQGFIESQAQAIAIELAANKAEIEKALKQVRKLHKLGVNRPPDYKRLAVILTLFQVYTRAFDQEPTYKKDGVFTQVLDALLESSTDPKVEVQTLRGKYQSEWPKDVYQFLDETHYTRHGTWSKVLKDEQEFWPEGAPLDDPEFHTK